MHPKHFRVGCHTSLYIERAKALSPEILQIFFSYMNSMAFSTGQLEEHAFFLLFMITVIVVYWHAVWGILDKIESYVLFQTNMTKTEFHVITILFVILIIGIFPKILQKF